MFSFKLLRLKIFLLALSALLLSSCANVRYGNDFKSDTDFSGLKSYNWRAASSEVNGLNSTRLQQLVDTQMQANGFVLKTADADLLLDVQAFSRVSTGGGTSIGLGLGLPIGNSGGIGLGTGQQLNRNKQEGVIVIDITKASSNQLIWRGNAEKIPLSQFSLKTESELSAVVARLIDQFPPKAK